jgi:hypothetical protein
VILVSHLRKKEGAAIHRTIGSLAFVAAARAAWILCKDPAAPNGRLLLPIKNNLAPNATGLKFTIESNNEHHTPIICWSPEPVTETIDTIEAAATRNGRPDTERQYAIEWLKKTLAAGPRSSKDIRREADVHGIAYHTLRRAFRELNGEAVRDGVPPFAPWKWKLPGIDAQNPGEEFWASSIFSDNFPDLDEFLNHLHGKHATAAPERAPQACTPTAPGSAGGSSMRNTHPQTRDFAQTPGRAGGCQSARTIDSPSSVPSTNTWRPTTPTKSQTETPSSTINSAIPSACQPTS